MPRLAPPALALLLLATGLVAQDPVAVRVPAQGLQFSLPAAPKWVAPQGRERLAFEVAGVRIWIESLEADGLTVRKGLEKVAADTQAKGQALEASAWAPRGAKDGFRLLRPDGAGFDAAALALRANGRGHLLGARAKDAAGRTTLLAVLDQLALITPSERASLDGVPGASIACPDGWVLEGAGAEAWRLQATADPKTRIHLAAAFPSLTKAEAWQAHLAERAKALIGDVTPPLAPDLERSKDAVVVFRDAEDRRLLALTGVGRIEGHLEAGAASTLRDEGLRLLQGLEGGSDPLAGQQVSRFNTRQGPPVRFVLPKGWEVRDPSRQMRLAEVRIPGDPELVSVVYWFGPGGGGDETSNLTRWKGQFAEIAGEKVTRKDLGNGLRLTLLDAHGRYAAETTPGSGDRVNEPGTRMLAAIIDCPRGPLFIKTTGPKSQMDGIAALHQAWLESFTATP